MEPARSVIADRLGIGVLGLLAGLSALSFLASQALEGRAPAGGVGDVAAAGTASPAVEAEGAGAAAREVQEGAAAEQARESLRRELDTLTRQHEAAAAALENAREEKEALGREMAAVTAERENLKARVAEQEARHDGLAREKAALAGQLETARTASRGELDRLKSELEAARRKAADDAGAWSVARAQFEASAANLAQQNELLKNRLAEGMSGLLPEGGGQNAAAALNRSEALVGKLRGHVAELEQKIDALGIQRNELSRALRAIQSRGPVPPPDGEDAAASTGQRSPAEDRLPPKPVPKSE